MDTYFKKEIAYSYKGQKYTFSVANTLFSTFNIDLGTNMLLRYIVLNNPRTILDIGCGYGPIGIVLAKTNPKVQVTMIDSNLLAVRYTNYNIKKNNIPNATVIGSVGMEEVIDSQYDLIVSNIPAKIGDQAITQEFILTPYGHLNEKGELWIVAVSALNHLIPRVGTKYTLNMKLIKKRKGYSLYRIKRQ